jgi:DNA-binding beta-propeller fold protein YncE
MNPDGHTIYLTDRVGNGTDEVVPVNTATGTTGTPIHVPGEPIGLTISPDGHTAYVSTDGGAEIVPVNLKTRVDGAPIRVSDGTDSLAIASDGTTAYATGDTGLGNKPGVNLIPINLASGVVGTPIPLRFYAKDVALSSDGRTAYITDGLGVRFVDLTTGKVTLTIRLRGGANSISTTPP